MSNAEINPFRLEERPEPAPNHTVLTGFEFLRDFRMEAQRAKQRVWGQAMAIYPSHPGQLFLETFRQTALRGVDARLNVDWFTFLAAEEGFPNGINAFIKPKRLLGKGNYHEFLRDHNLLALASLSSEKKADDLNIEDVNALIHGVDTNRSPRSVKVHLTNPPTRLQKYFPFTGRNHIKIEIVDDIAYLEE